MKIRISLNPTLIWIWSLTQLKAFCTLTKNSLNPTLIWIWSLTNQPISISNLDKEGLNPTLIWIWSLTLCS